MRKLRSDARWHQLTTEQQNQIRTWLLVENLSYAETHQRMRTQLGITCARSSIGPLYHYLHELRSCERETILQKLTETLTEPGTDIARIRTDTLAVISKRLIQRASDRQHTGEMVALARVMLRGELRELQRDRIELGRQNLAMCVRQANQLADRRAKGQMGHSEATPSSEVKRHEASKTGLDRDKPA